MKDFKKYITGKVQWIIVLVFLISSNMMATVYTFDLSLAGLNEVPPVASPATGILIGDYDDGTNILNIYLTFSGLIGTTTAAHIHGPAGPGVNGPVTITLVGFPLGVASGTYANSFVLTPVQEADLIDGLLYVNFHTVAFPGGEIRGQMIEGTLPDDNPGVTIPVSNWALLLGGLLIVTYAYFMIRRRL